MIPPAYACGVSRYIKEMIKICEWGKNEMSAFNLLGTALFRKIHEGGTWQCLVRYERAYQKEDVPHFYPTRTLNLAIESKI